MFILVWFTLRSRDSRLLYEREQGGNLFPSCTGDSTGMGDMEVFPETQAQQILPAQGKSSCFGGLFQLQWGPVQFSQLVIRTGNSKVTGVNQTFRFYQFYLLKQQQTGHNSLLNVLGFFLNATIQAQNRENTHLIIHIVTFF